ncbi:MAG: WXG100 family type VII secretion target [Mycobacterium sp.]|nr:WXG100 family type VII secretion target [Mycobacterium sp.]
MRESFRVDPEALADAVARMTELHRRAETMLGEIEALVTNLDAARSGRRAAAHAEAHRHWARGEALMREALAVLLTPHA